MKIGIFSGSFNPIHIGHLILANYITEFSELDEVWFLVTPQNPLKQNLSLADERFRLDMVQLAIENYPKLKVSDIEFSLPRPSFTINTLHLLKETYPEHEFSLIIGADNWESFTKWKNFEAILDTFKIYVYPRLGYRVSLQNKFKGTVEVIDSPIVEVSSTFIRESIKDGKTIRAFLPDKVSIYIEKNGLYAD